MRLVKPCSVKRFFDSTEHSEVELVSSTKEKRHRKKGEKAKKRSRQKIIHSPARELALRGEKGKTESPSTTKEPKGRVVLTCTGVCSTTSSVNNLSYVKQNSWESSSKQVMPRNLSRRQLRSQGALREDLLQSISPIVPPTSFSLSFTREVLGLFTAHRGTQKPQGKGSLDWHVHTVCAAPCGWVALGLPAAKSCSFRCNVAFACISTATVLVDLPVHLQCEHALHS